MREHRDVAIVTGAASGIGSALAVRLQQPGRTVVGVDLNPCPTKVAVRHDVADLAAAEPLVDTIEAEHGPITALANVAGTFVPEPAFKRTIPNLRRQLGVMFEGPVFLARAAAARMAARRAGRIVNVTSIHSTNASRIRSPTTPRRRLSSGVAFAGDRAGRLQSSGQRGRTWVHSDPDVAAGRPRRASRRVFPAPLC